MGFDILLMKNMKPMLLEVNSSPSLRIDYDKEVALGITERVISPVDDEVKRELVLDTLILVAPKVKILWSPRLDKIPTSTEQVT